MSSILSDRLDLFPKSQTPRLARHIMTLCQQYHFDPAFILSLIEIESSFRIKAVSRVGALGLMQVMPPTAQFVLQSIGVDTARMERAEALLKLEKYPDLESDFEQAKIDLTRLATEKKDLELVVDDYKARLDSLTVALQKMSHVEGENKNLKQTLADYKAREETTQSQLAGFQKFAADAQRMTAEVQQKQADETRKLLDAMKTKYEADLESAKDGFERSLEDLKAEYEGKIQTAAAERANRFRDIAASSNANMRRRRGMPWKAKN